MFNAFNASAIPLSDCFATEQQRQYKGGVKNSCSWMKMTFGHKFRQLWTRLHHVFICVAKTVNTYLYIPVKNYLFKETLAQNRTRTIVFIVIGVNLYHF